MGELVLRFSAATSEMLLSLSIERNSVAFFFLARTIAKRYSAKINALNPLEHSPDGSRKHGKPFNIIAHALVQ